MLLLAILKEMRHKDKTRLHGLRGHSLSVTVHPAEIKLVPKTLSRVFHEHTKVIMLFL